MSVSFNFYKHPGGKMVPSLFSVGEDGDLESDLLQDSLLVCGKR